MSGRLIDKPLLPPIKRSGSVDVGSQENLDYISATNRPKTGIPVYRSPRKLPKLVGGRTPNIDFSEAALENGHHDQVLIEQVRLLYTCQLNLG